MEERCLALKRYSANGAPIPLFAQLTKARTFIAQHYTDTELSVEMLCDHLHLPLPISQPFSKEKPE